MTKKQKAKKAVKEANKVADIELIKSKVSGYRKNVLDWLNSETYDYKRFSIIVAVIVAIVVIL